MANSLKEKEVWKHFKRLWPWHAERQEPGAGFDAGKPDVLLLGKTGIPGLVELKAPTRWQLRPSQWIWHERWFNSHGKAVVLTCEVYDGETKPAWYVSRITYQVLVNRKLAKEELLQLAVVPLLCKYLRLDP